MGHPPHPPCTIHSMDNQNGEKRSGSSEKFPFENLPLSFWPSASLNSKVQLHTMHCTRTVDNGVSSARANSTSCYTIRRGGNSIQSILKFPTCLPPVAVVICNSLSFSHCVLIMCEGTALAPSSLAGSAVQRKSNLIESLSCNQMN